MVDYFPLLIIHVPTNIIDHVQAHKFVFLYLFCHNEANFRITSAPTHSAGFSMHAINHSSNNPPVNPQQENKSHFDGEFI